MRTIIKSVFVIILIFLSSNIVLARGGVECCVLPQFTKANPEYDKYAEPINKEMDEYIKKNGDEKFIKFAISELEWIASIKNSDIKFEVRKVKGVSFAFIHKPTGRYITIEDRARFLYIINYAYKTGNQEIANYLENIFNKKADVKQYFYPYGKILGWVYLIRTKNMPQEEKLFYLVNGLMSTYPKSPIEHQGYIEALWSEALILNEEDIFTILKAFENHCNYISNNIKLSEEEKYKIITESTHEVKKVIFKKGNNRHIIKMREIISKSGLNSKLREKLLNEIREKK